MDDLTYVAIEANRLGRKGIEVVGVIMPTTATDDPKPKFIIAPPEPKTATDGD